MVRSIKISALKSRAGVDLAAGNLLTIVDTNTRKTEKVSLKDFLGNVPVTLGITDGSRASPSISFTSDPDTGLFLQGPNILSVTAGGVESIRATTVAGAVNCLVLTPSVAGAGATLTVDGTDANIDLLISPKGTGTVVVTGDLTVRGLTTTIDTTILLVEDKNIVLGNVAGPTDITADGGGITLRGTTNKTITWIDATKSWTFNEDIDALTNIIRTTGVVTGGFVIGTTSVFGGNLLLSGNTLSSANANGDILLVPNGTGKIEIPGPFQISSGGPGLDKVLTSDATGLATWQEDLGTSVAQETFASTNARFFGELALPAAQGWIDTATGSATIDLDTQLVFGESKQVVRHNDNVGNGSTTSKILLTAQNWVDINTFGASYGGVARLDTVNGSSGFFSGLQANSAENPLATGNRRYGLTFSNVGGNLNVSSAGGSSVVMDGTSGNPLVVFDEWFLWEAVIPAGLGAAELFINKILTTLTPAFNVNTGGLGTQVLLSSGSTGGTARVAYHENFGVTIFEETATKTLLAATMAGDVAQVNIPEGKRDYTIILPDGKPRAIGATLRLVANNVLGLISLENQNPAAPEILYNGLRTLVLEIAVKEVIGGINTVDPGNVYIGFKDEDIDRAKSIFAQLSSSVDQIPSTTTPQVITYNTQDEINGIGHSTSLNPGELEILPGAGGVYFVSPQPQVGKDTGATKVDLDMFWEIDRGSGFVDEPNSNVKLTIKDAEVTDVIVSAFTISLAVGDKIRMLQKVSSSTVGMGLKNTDPVVGPPTVPRTPSIILTMYRVGGF